ncbi:MAG: tetratricopeptide repeat protein [Spirochaetaceae bacterium]|jgi:tetratricopeptide (TPR) repeat protein|nr:tetratricopeptide repeat protein [Spirochaetaceae bacterium]
MEKERKGKKIKNARILGAGAVLVLVLNSCAGYRDWIAEPGDYGTGAAKRKAGQSASRSRDSRADAEIAAGIAYYTNGAYPKAVAAFTRALEIEPRSAYVLNWRGFVWRLHGKYDRAVADHSAALKTKPDREDRFNAYYHRGLAYYFKGHFNLAAEDYTEALIINPQDVDTLNLRGAAHLADRSYDKAVGDYLTALRIRPEDLYARIELERAQRIRREPSPQPPQPPQPPAVP